MQCWGVQTQTCQQTSAHPCLMFTQLFTSKDVKSQTKRQVLMLIFVQIKFLTEIIEITLYWIFTNIRFSLETSYFCTLSPASCFATFWIIVFHQPYCSLRACTEYSSNCVSSLQGWFMFLYHLNAGRILLVTLFVKHWFTH